MQYSTHDIQQGNNFNFIRLVAALMVIITHTYVLVGLGVEHDILYKLTKGETAISITGLRTFFVISGFLIIQSMERSTGYMSYLSKRILRIFPGLAICLLVTILIIGTIFTSASLTDYLFNSNMWMYLKNIFLYQIQFEITSLFESNPNHTVNGSIWTLAYEFSYYIMIMVLCSLGIFKRKWIGIITFLLFWGIRVYTLYADLPPSMLHFLIYTDLQLDHFADFGLFFTAGMLLYLYKNTIFYKHAVAAIMLILYVVSIAIELSWTVKYIALPYLIMYLAFVPKNTIVTNWGKKTDFSYGIYIYGMPVQQVVIAQLGTSLYPDLISVCVLIFLVPIAWLSWHIIEKPALQLARKV